MSPGSISSSGVQLRKSLEVALRIQRTPPLKLPSPATPRVYATYSPRLVSQKATLGESNGYSVMTGSSCIRLQWMPSGEATAWMTLERTMPL